MRATGTASETDLLPTAVLRLLLVEDDDGDAFLFEELLKDADLAVDVSRARTVAGAEAALTADVSCVVLDLGLPDADGLAALLRLLINDLLAFSRVGRVGAEHVLLDMGEIAAQAMANLESAIEEAGATVEVRGPLPPVRGDRSLLTALLQNLIANGIKFRSDDAPHVRLSVASPADGAYTFAVDDNGIGIAPRYADRIFVIFQRLHPKEEYSGTGIGLAMCRKIVEFHGGEIRLEPEGADGGASFRFTLPVPEEDAT